MPKTQSKHQVVNDYFGRLEAKDAQGGAALFSPDAVVLPSPLPADGPVRGRAAIEQLLKGFVSVDMNFLERRVHDDERSSTVELRVSLPGGKILEVVDIFDVDHAGKIERMSVYKR